MGSKEAQGKKSEILTNFVVRGGTASPRGKKRSTEKNCTFFQSYLKKRLGEGQRIRSKGCLGKSFEWGKNSGKKQKEGQKDRQGKKKTGTKVVDGGK